MNSDIPSERQQLLRAVQNKQTDVWEQFIDQYQGRLLAFALSRLPQAADAEDAVQDTFVLFIKALDRIQIDCTIETYLFGILRNVIISRFRTRWSKSICLVQDVFDTTDISHCLDAVKGEEGNGNSVSWHVCRNEQFELQQQVLSEAIRHLITAYKEKRKLRDLKITEALFYARLPNKEAAGLLNLDEAVVRIVKHRSLKRVSHAIARLDKTDSAFPLSDNLLSGIWESHRLSCPKRSTLGAFILESLEPEWFEYVDFHITILGCHFCRASFKDLQEQSHQEHTLFRERVMASTVGFLT